jgi:hypothetical protein
MEQLQVQEASLTRLQESGDANQLTKHNYYLQQSLDIGDPVPVCWLDPATAVQE